MAEEHTYIAGDTIRVRVHLQHSANIQGVGAKFVPTVGSGEPVEFYEPRTNPEIYFAKRDQLITNSAIELKAEITSEHHPGEYYCQRLWAELGSGREVDFNRLPDFRFRVLQEPQGSPQLGRWEVAGSEGPGATGDASLPNAPSYF